MGSDRTFRNHVNGRTAALAARVIGAGAILLTAAVAFAQEGAKAAAQAPRQDPGFFGEHRALVRPAGSELRLHLKGAGSQVENFGHEAGVAAKIDASTAPRAPPTRWRGISDARVVSGHEKCTIAPNGAPDCVAAANDHVQDARASNPARAST